MYLIGLTGGIASGKSLVSARLVEHGALIVDADVLAREVVQPGTEGLAQIAGHFGPSVIAADGSLNRPALGAIIFSDPEQREKLNSITHPAVWKRAREMFAAAPSDSVVVYDVPLLVEGAKGRQLDFDLVVVVNASTDTRLRRLMELRGMTREEAMHRLNSQASDTERLAVADVVIENNGTVDETMLQVDALWAKASASASALSGAESKLE
jgi:dephospho-CoA kinase